MPSGRVLKGEELFVENPSRPLLGSQIQHLPPPLLLSLHTPHHPYIHYVRPHSDVYPHYPRH